MTENDSWTLSDSELEEYVFCHHDLSQHNIIVEPETLKIAAIVDWEYAGFFPEYFESPFYTRPGPSVAIKEEIDDTSRLLEFLTSHTVSLINLSTTTHSMRFKFSNMLDLNVLLIMQLSGSS